MAVMWKADPVEMAQRKETVHMALHRYAGQAGFSCMPKASSIDRGRYYAEINEYVGDGAVRPNVAMGVGATPLDAAYDGYKRLLPNDPVILAFGLEIEVYWLRVAVTKARTNEEKLERAIDLLTDAMRMVNPEQ